MSKPNPPHSNSNKSSAHQASSLSSPNKTDSFPTNKTPPSLAQSNSTQSSSIQTNNSQAKIAKQKRHKSFWLSCKKWFIRILVLFILTAVGYAMYTFGALEWWQNNLSNSTNDNQTTSINQSDITLLKQQLNALQQQIRQQQRQNLQQQQQLLENLQQQQNNQKRQLISLSQQMAGINSQFNRWKQQLSQPERLIDAILNHLNLIQTQSLLNYSPALLAQQLTSIDAMLAELRIEELSIARVEIQQLINELDEKPIAPTQFWLQEIELAHRSVEIWVSQQLESVQTENQTIRSENALNKDLNANQTTADSSNQSWYQRLFNHLLARLGSSLKIQSIEQPKTSTIAIDKIAQEPINQQQLKRQLNDRLESLKLSLLANRWDQLRLQSLELQRWLTENLSNVNTNLAETLARMSQYKPSAVNLSLAKVIQAIEDYKFNPAAQSIIENNNFPQPSSTTVEPHSADSTPANPVTPTAISSPTSN